MKLNRRDFIKLVKLHVTIIREKDNIPYSDAELEEPRPVCPYKIQVYTKKFKWETIFSYQLQKDRAEGMKYLLSYGHVLEAERYRRWEHQKRG